MDMCVVYTSGCAFIDKRLTDSKRKGSFVLLLSVLKFEAQCSTPREKEFWSSKYSPIILTRGYSFESVWP